eukprot:TRINITY_DN48213_c0_g1_i1.p2 TRINITY_DN48213_c0_g1~~TRINITY_DN48213_c0_g1_i1.p2  ORF type:complete len:335 (-),score=90.88 TRINITY_DN48213_c0_g1_i1:197-1201(-)
MDAKRVADHADDEAPISKHARTGASNRLLGLLAENARLKAEVARLRTVVENVELRAELAALKASSGDGSSVEARPVAPKRTPKQKAKAKPKGKGKARAKKYPEVTPIEELPAPVTSTTESVAAPAAPSVRPAGESGEILEGEEKLGNTAGEQTCLEQAVGSATVPADADLQMGCEDKMKGEEGACEDSGQASARIEPGASGQTLTPFAASFGSVLPVPADGKKVIELNLDLETDGDEEEEEEEEPRVDEPAEDLALDAPQVATESTLTEATSLDGKPAEEPANEASELHAKPAEETVEEASVQDGRPAEEPVHEASAYMQDKQMAEEGNIGNID